MRRQLKYDLLTAVGVSYGVGIALLFEWPTAFILLTVPAATLAALTRWRRASADVAPLAQAAWMGPVVIGIIFLIAFNGSWEANVGWDQTEYTGFDVAQFGLIATFGACLGVAAMVKPRPRHTWAVSPLVGALVYCGLFFAWLLVVL